MLAHLTSAVAAAPIIAAIATATAGVARMPAFHVRACALLLL